jgi:Ca2+-binding RTX toxin-like protein
VRRVSLAFLAAMAMLIAVPSGATAGTQLGQTFVPAVDCPQGETRLQTGSPSPPYSASSAGVITAWSFQADAAPPQLKFKVARPAGGNDYTIVGESALVAPAPSQLNTFAVEIPVQPGDLIGTYTGTAGRCATGDFSIHTVHSTPGDVPPGTTQTFGAQSFEQLDVSANLESPPCKGQAPTSVGTSGPDTLTGTSGPDVIAALGGDDRVFGLEGDDLICGDEGRDRLVGGRGKDRLFGQQGKDRLLGRKGRDTLNGGGGRDVCKGGKGDDSAKCEVERSI